MKATLSETNEEEKELALYLIWTLLRQGVHGLDARIVTLMNLTIGDVITRRKIE